MNYFIALDLGYDGIIITKYINKEKAILEFNTLSKEYDEEKYEELKNPVILIEGNVILNKEFEINEEQF